MNRFKIQQIASDYGYIKADKVIHPGNEFKAVDIELLYKHLNNDYDYAIQLHLYNMAVVVRVFSNGKTSEPIIWLYSKNSAGCAAGGTIDVV